MFDLDSKVFGRVAVKEIIGASPPASETREILKRELLVLVRDLDSAADPGSLLEQQMRRAAHINSRPGAMALAQDKIRLFNEYHERYVEEIRQKIS
ncbi:MAG: hypothetical protein D9C04_02875 [Nitrosopumilus sp. B06]|nr:MAG: hypothetical protein EB828_02590 [Nitrosopumilus sp. D6]RNJ80076.1 MAG: hypothetical protein D9C04_02875 [Nitrosopumilus sp. B06]